MTFYTRRHPLHRALLCVLLLGLACRAGDAGAPDEPPPGKAECPSGQHCAYVPAAFGGRPPSWPAAGHEATSDPWLVTRHRDLVALRPRVLAVNFDNDPQRAQGMTARVQALIAALAAGSTFQGYLPQHAGRAPFVQYELVRTVDLRDQPAPGGWPCRNSTLFPRERPKVGRWGLDYARLFDPAFASRYGYWDATLGRHLALCELVERGIVHELWLHADGIDGCPAVGDGEGAELLGMQPYYDESGAQTGAMSYCAGNGCFDAEDLDDPQAAIRERCRRTLRVLTINSTRGIGCALESYAHAIEGTALGNTVPALREPFRELAGFDLHERHGTPHASWYACDYNVTCLRYPTASSVDYDLHGFGPLQLGIAPATREAPMHDAQLTPAEPKAGSIEPYAPVCGNAHFPPNARGHYDRVNTAAVLSTCQGFRQREDAGRDRARPVSSNDWARYEALAPDCMGPWLVWWLQNLPAPGGGARDDGGALLPSFWPYLFY